MLKSATKEELEKLLRSWLAVCGNQGDEGSVFAQDIENKIRRLINDIDEKEFFAYILSDEDDKEYIALLDVIRALPRSDVGWLKIFDMTITPKCTLNGGDHDEIANALKSVFMESLKLLLSKDHEDIKEIKIFARNEITKNLFENIANSEGLNKDLDDIGVVILFEAKWLILRKKDCNPKTKEIL